MKSFLLKILAACVLCLCTSRSFAQTALSLDAPAYGSPFQVVKTYQEQALAIGGTKLQQMKVQRNILMTRYGATGVDRMFQNYSPDPSVDGIGKTLRLATSDNANQAKGYKRTLLYEKEFSQGGKFKVLATDKVITTSSGKKTDVDLLLEHRASGEKVLLEVKDEKLSGQNVLKYKLKIQRLADYAKTHGGKPVIASRYALKTEIKDFARENGVSVYENVATGKLSGQKPGNMRFRDMEEDLSQSMNKAARARFVAGGAGSAVGIVLLYTSGHALLADLESPHDDFVSQLRVGENAFLFASGGAMTTAGIATMAKLGSVAKWGGRVSIVTFIAAEGIAVVKDAYQWEHLSEGQKYVALIRHGSNALLIFVMIPQNPLSKNPWVAGSLSLLGLTGHGMAYLLEKYYAELEEEQRRQIRAFIYQHYGVRE